MSYETIEPRQLQERIRRGDNLRLVDVRESAEYALARIEGAELLPLSRFNQWAHSLDPDDEIVVICHHGIRSAHVCAALASEGFRKLYNLAGGIDRWSQEVDAEVPQY
ncbi:MAG TPA: rhodanese-like domain-containing protein [Pyrinomonadaceae bacterium]|jgi:rhodanese-related sulfurtransferase|nr:rhodanese-like domain-containing protein [Pyrinomonadaceae bacterium]